MAEINFIIDEGTQKKLRERVLWEYAEDLTRNHFDLQKTKCYKLKDFYARLIEKKLSKSKYLIDNPKIKDKLSKLLFKEDGKFKAGVPDLIQIRENIPPMFMEVKNKTSKLSNKQRAKMKKIVELGLYYYTVYCNISADFYKDENCKIIAEHRIIHKQENKELEEQNKKGPLQDFL